MISIEPKNGKGVSLQISEAREWDGGGTYVSLSFGPISLHASLTKDESLKLMESVRISLLPQEEREAIYKKNRGY